MAPPWLLGAVVGSLLSARWPGHRAPALLGVTAALVSGWTAAVLPPGG
ncbi:hypothetical protein ACFCZ1_11570 [Streptomyces sp. NPDC056224]